MNWSKLIKSNNLVQKQFLRALFFIFFFSFLIISCGDVPFTEDDNSEGTVEDLYPYTTLGRVVTWKNTNNIKLYLPTSTAPNFEPYHLDEMNSALNIWKDILKERNINLDIVNTDQSNDIEIVWQANIGNNILGYATFNSSENPSRKIVLSYSFNNQAYVRGVVFKIALHELGHIFGLWSHSFSKDDVMYPFLGSLTQLSNRDKKTFEKVYTLNPDINLKSWPANTLVGTPPTTTNLNFPPETLSGIIKCAFTFDKSLISVNPD